MAANELLDHVFNRALTKYQHPELCQQDIIKVRQVYTDLRTSVDEFVFNNGDRKELLTLVGTIPVEFKGQTYNIPLRIWFVETHPFNPPVVYVCPTSNMRIAVGKYVDSNGRVYLPYLHQWKHPNFNITTLVGILSAEFGLCPPVHSPPRQSSSHGSRVSQTPDDSEQTLCVVCMEKEKVIAFIPCGHLTCADCAVLLDKCPECRGPIQGRMKIYM